MGEIAFNEGVYVFESNVGTATVHVTSNVSSKAVERVMMEIAKEVCCGRKKKDAA